MHGGRAVFALFSCTFRPGPSRLAPVVACTRGADDGDAAVKRTREWIEGHVIRLGLCPFASRPFMEEQIRYVVTDASCDEELLEDFYTEAALLLQTEEEDLATSFVIAPQYSEGIEGFHLLYEWLVDNLESANDDESRTAIEVEVGNRVQPAFFHPQWSFHGVPTTSPVHFEKRAPYPVINLLRRATLNHGEVRDSNHRS